MKNDLLINGVRILLLNLLLCVAGMNNVAQAQLTEWEQQQPYLFYLVYADVQAHETEMPHLGATADMRYEQLPHDESIFFGNYDYWYGGGFNHTIGILGLAKNEKMGFQVFYREQEKTRNLSVEVTSFLNENGDELPHTVYYEEFFKTDAYASDSLAEALVPYRGDWKTTSVGHNKMFYVELNSSKEQPTGVYISTISIFENGVLLTSKTVKAKVWNFSLPESHYSEVIMGLHNNNSGYVCTQNFLIYNGVNMSNGTPVTEEDRLLAKQILIGYQDFLLNHGVSTYELPRWLIDDDPKATELTMADPRRKMFTVPVHHGYMSGSVFNQEASNLIAQYKGLVYNNPFLKDKAYFHLLDEPAINSATASLLNNMSIELINKWGPDYHAVAPFNSNYDAALELFEGKVDILCPNQGFFNPRATSDYNALDARLYDFMEKPHTWRYYPTGDLTNGDVVCYIFPLLSVGTMRRVLFWQQFVIKSDGILHWNCASFGDNPWTNKTLPTGNEVFWTGQGNNGDGILLYPGLPINEEAAIPIASLRLKQIVIGLNDYDYLKLTEEFLGEEAVASNIQEIFWTMNAHVCNIMSKETGFDAWTSYSMNRIKYQMGQALSDAANTEHNWGEWQTAVLPDENHDGLEIRACSHCGTQESRPKTYSSLYRFVGTENNQWANLNNWANNPETLPAPGEAVVIAHDCEINSNTTQFYVVVNDGFSLTINEGSTLTAQRITTEGNAQIIIEDGAQLYTMSEGVQATVKKSIAPHNGTGGWHFVSTSLASDVVPSTSNNIVSSTAGNYDLYLFDQSENLEWRNYKVHGFNLENGKGYLYANGEENVSLEFTGTTNRNSQKEFGLAYDANAEFAGWNLVGNPYPCNVYAGKSYYVLDESGSMIEPNTVSSSIPIAPCTGIMVKTETTDETVTFSKTAPETQCPNNGSLQIAVAQANTRGNSIQDKAIVSFNAGDELEKFFFNEDNAKLYIPQGGKEFAIACSEKSGEMPLNFKATKDGIYTLSVNPDNVDLDYLHLIDNLTGADVDLLQTPAYSFTAKTTDYTSRFRLVFFANDASSDPASDAPFAFISNGSIVIIGAEADAVLQIVDMQGRIIVCCDAAHHVSIDGMTSGVYVLRLIEGESIRTQKIVIE